MTTAAKAITLSVSPHGIKLATLQLRYPKCFHGEAKTHRQMRIADKAYEFLEEVALMDDRALSRNASSSRAIPVERMIEDVMRDPYIPSQWGKNQRGMQALEECMNAIAVRGRIPGFTAHMSREAAWLYARDFMVMMARAFADAGYHKQIVNRLLEPWLHINVVVTATEWANFLALRDHGDAQPEMQELASKVREALGGRYTIVRQGEWHLPYVTDLERMTTFDTVKRDRDWPKLIKLSVARCARVSYRTHGNQYPELAEDLGLHDRLIGPPLHASPFEHQASPDAPYVFSGPEPGAPPVMPIEWSKPHLHGNLVGWIQHRKTLEGECVNEQR